MELDAESTSSADFEETAVATTQSSESSDDFDYSKPASETKKILKPSRAQKEAETKTNKAEIVNAQDIGSDDDGIAIQSNVLAEYLQPTNILSQYQNPSGHSENESKQENESPEIEFEVEDGSVEDEFERANAAYDQNSFVADDKESDTQQYDRSENVTFNEMFSYLSSQIETDPDIEIQIHDFRKVDRCSWLCFNIFGPPTLSDELELERDYIFKIAKLSLDQCDSMHDRLMQTLWMKIGGLPTVCAKTGSHWEMLGFQGSNPASDIRGSGLMGLLQLLSMSISKIEIMSKIYQLSQNDYSGFPFAVVSFNITGILLNILRQTRIYSEIKRQNSVTKVFNELHCALFYHFYLQWKNNSRTVKDFGAAKAELETVAMSQWKTLLQQLRDRNNDSNIKSKKGSKPEDIAFGQSKANQTSSNSNGIQSRISNYIQSD